MNWFYNLKIGKKLIISFFMMKTVELVQEIRKKRTMIPNTTIPSLNGIDNNDNVVE